MEKSVADDVVKRIVRTRRYVAQENSFPGLLGECGGGADCESV